MQLLSEPLPGCKVLEPFFHRDPRGDFVKPYHEEQLAEQGIRLTVREEFFSESAIGVVRGMHFQLPPAAHQKLVYCIKGRVLDVFLDLRTSSDTYGCSAAVELSEENRYVLYLPVGLAHGFLSLTDQSCVVYKTDSVHSPENDSGILWNSFGFDWPLHEIDPVLSARDRNHPLFSDFKSPF